MLRVLQCTAKQMAHFILETNPFLSMGVHVSKEVLEWNHLSESYSGNGRSLRSFTTCMGDGLTRKQKKGEKVCKRNASCCISSIHHSAAQGDFLRTRNPIFARTKFVRSGERKAPGRMVTRLPSVRDPGNIRPAVHMWGSWLSSFILEIVLFPIQGAFQARPHLPEHCSNGKWPVQCGISITLCILGA